MFKRRLNQRVITLKDNIIEYLNVGKEREKTKGFK